MDVQINTIPPGSICEGCLSVDRRLSPILDVESRRFFLEVLHPLVNASHPLYLCWECKSLTLRVLSFKKRIKKAHDCLVRYMHHQITEITTLSQLKLQKITQEANIFENPCEFNNLKDDLDHESDVTNKNKLYTVHENSENESIFNKPNPVFVKMEDNNSDDGFDMGDENLNITVDSKSETLLNSDEFKLKKQSTKSNVKTRRKTKKNPDKEIEFDDSDDEPLKFKKERADDDKPGGKKKKETKGLKAKRREKPAGVVHNARVEKKLQQLNVTSDQVQMVVLSWEEVEAERRAAAQNPAYTRLQHRCSSCVLGFNHTCKLEAHMAKHSPSAGESVCKVCTVRCRDAHALSAHMRRHRVRWRCVACGGAWSRAAIAADHVARVHGAAKPTLTCNVCGHCEPWRCVACGGAWSRAAIAADHVARVHGAAKPTLTCNVCGHCEPTLGRLRVHKKSHAERQKCELCDKTFKDRNSLRTHLFIHKGEKEYACPRCDKKFLFKKAMEVHLVTHDESQQLYCHQCDMNFKNQMSYYQHMRYNLKHIDPEKLKYACKECGKRFAKASRLHEHNVAVHLKATPIKCTVIDCSFACASRPVLRTHIRMVHRNLRTVRNHVCHTCGKAYKTKKTLEGHLRSHTGERPFLCGRCPAAFGHSAARHNHTRRVHCAPAVRSKPPVDVPDAWPDLTTQDNGTDS